LLHWIVLRRGGRGGRGGRSEEKTELQNAKQKNIENGRWVNEGEEKLEREYGEGVERERLTSSLLKKKKREWVSEQRGQSFFLPSIVFQMVDFRKEKERKKWYNKAFWICNCKSNLQLS
jgi:hypothetical protein